MELEKEIRAILERAADEIRSNMAAKGINASHRTEQSLTVETYNEGIRLIFKDGAPAETLEVGRAPGPVPHRFDLIIRQWMHDKGIEPLDEKEARRMAGSIAYGKIARKGTLRHRDGSKRENIFSTVREKTTGELNDILALKVAGYV